jgi:putative oxygen-independent coproporphyrinogen III oxidase
VTTAARSPAAAGRWLATPVESGAAAGFGVYLHVPFCHHRCGYCDFATVAVGDGDEALYDRYLSAMVADIDRWSHRRGDWPVVTSVFVGGGTPTMIGARRLTALLEALRTRFELAADVEVTVEANPETCSVALFDALAAAGVTRVSMGAQSFVTHVLARLERGHSASRTARAVDEARRGGIDAVSLDLIYGTPGESDDDWAASLRGVLETGVDHVSAYALTIHDNTSFGRALAAGSMPRPDDDVLSDRFEVARALLPAAGFEHYEVSNFARGTMRRSRHNVLYWRHGDYVGIGVGAHGHLDGRRWWTTRSIERYCHALETGGEPIAGTEDLSVDERAAERLMLGLRLSEGLHPNDVPPLDALALEDAMDAGLITTACGRLQATDHGWYLLDEAVTRLMP